MWTFSVYILIFHIFNVSHHDIFIHTHPALPSHHSPGLLFQHRSNASKECCRWPYGSLSLPLCLPLPTSFFSFSPCKCVCLHICTLWNYVKGEHIFCKSLSAAKAVRAGKKLNSVLLLCTWLPCVKDLWMWPKWRGNCSSFPLAVLGFVPYKGDWIQVEYSTQPGTSNIIAHSLKPTNCSHIDEVIGLRVTLVISLWQFFHSNHFLAQGS